MMLALAGLDEELLTSAVAADRVANKDQVRRQRPPHRLNRPEPRFERERFRLSEWGWGVRASAVLNARERAARQRAWAERRA
jgi:hypothetical protein